MGELDQFAKERNTGTRSVRKASTYGSAAVITAAAALASGLLVRRRLDKLDLVAVLKSRD